MKCRFVCLDIGEQDGFSSRSIIFTYMQADITPALDFVFLSLIAVHKDIIIQTRSLTICIIKESRDHRKNKTKSQQSK